MCDMAETYHIFSFNEIPLTVLATLASGLRENSRIKQKISGEKLSFEQMVNIGILDCLRILTWQNSKDGAKNRNRPKSILKQFTKEKKTDVISFDSAADFELARNKLKGE